MNNNKIKGKKYYRITFVNSSALSIGSGRNDNTDKDIVLDSLGRPYIPATALAGLYRSICGKANDSYFGMINGETSEDSRVITYDATMTAENYKITSRDCVGLDRWKTAKEGAKFDFEILEPGVEFVTYIEQTLYSDDDTDIGKIITEKWSNGKIAMGGKSTRGLGQTKIIKLEGKLFMFPDKVSEWLDFNIFDYDNWEACKLESAHNSNNIHIELVQNGPVTVRSYTTRLSKNNDTEPDYEQLCYLRGDQSVPVIPGTSWAGAFRHQMLKLNKNCIGDYFGSSEAENKRKSIISFSESEISGAKSKVVTRNSIDRFTGGAVNNALFTEKMYYGGHTSLDISIAKYKLDEDFVRCLSAAIMDLHLGFLPIGGETSIGHGLFKVKSISYKEKKMSMSGEYGDCFNQICNMILGGEQNV